MQVVHINEIYTMLLITFNVTSSKIFRWNSISNFRGEKCGLTGTHNLPIFTSFHGFCAKNAHIFSSYERVCYDNNIFHCLPAATKKVRHNRANNCGQMADKPLATALHQKAKGSIYVFRSLKFVPFVRTTVFCVPLSCFQFAWFFSATLFGRICWNHCWYICVLVRDNIEEKG